MSASLTASIAAARNGIWRVSSPMRTEVSTSAGSTVTAPGTRETSSNP